MFGLKILPKGTLTPFLNAEKVRGEHRVDLLRTIFIKLLSLKSL